MSAFVAVKSLLGAVAAAVLLVGCRAATIQNFDNKPVAMGPAQTAVDVRTAIIMAAERRKWTIADNGPGDLIATFKKGKYMAQVSIPYTKDNYSIVYKDSENLKQTGTTISRHYVAWVKTLDNEIQKQLAVLGRTTVAQRPPPPQAVAPMQTASKQPEPARTEPNYPVQTIPKRTVPQSRSVTEPRLEYTSVRAATPTSAPDQTLSREPGEKRAISAEGIWDLEGCNQRSLPYFYVDRNEVAPSSITAGEKISHRLVYILCTDQKMRELPGSLRSTVSLGGKTMFTDASKSFRLKPGKWVVDSDIVVPDQASPGTYSLEVNILGNGVKFVETSSFQVID